MNALEEKEHALYEARVAKERLEKVANRLTTAFSVWALVVLGMGAGILKAQSDITNSVDSFRKEFTNYVIASEARLTRLEEKDTAAAAERASNQQRIRELEQQLRENGKSTKHTK